MATRTTHRPRRLLACLMAGVTLALAGCAGQGMSSQRGGSGKAPSTLTFWNGLTGGDRKAVDKIVADFNDSHQGVRVKSVPMPWDVFYQKLLTSVSSGHGPDIVAMDSTQVPKYAHLGILQPLDDFYGDKGAENARKLAPAAVRASEFKDVSFGVPLNLATLMLLWNKDVFKKAGLDPEKPPATWAEFERMAKRITADKNGDGRPDHYAIALADHETIPMYPILLWQNGGDVVSRDGKQATLDSPATLSALRHWTDLVRKQKVTRPGLGGADADKLFQSGRAAMEIIGPWATNALPGMDYGVARPFAGPKGQQTLASVTSFGVVSTANKATKKAAYKFFSFWNSKRSQLTLSRTAGFPPTRTDITAKDLKGYPVPAAYGDPAVVRSARPFLPGLVDAPTIADEIFYPALQKALNGKGDVDSLFKDADSKVQDLLDRQR